ncbi:MAG: TldD/PmbA family protein [Bacteroidales bacterium]|nr:TldD/PmbA family protein [Bacteroidales bacterium]
MLEKEELMLTRECLQMALEAGASKARASLSKNEMSIVATLDGEVDKVSGCLDRSISLNIFVDGRYGTFSTNKLDRESLRAFISKAVGTTRMLAEDAARDLPDPDRTAKDAVSGDELGICDPAWNSVTPEQRIAFALDNSVQRRQGRVAPAKFFERASCVAVASRDNNSLPTCAKKWKLISEEGEYSDSIYYNYVVDTQGTEALHSETSFEFFTELTIEDSRGRKYSGGWWEASPTLAGFHPEKVADAALEEAVMQIGPRRCRSGKYRAVIDSEVSQKVLNPILSALNAFNIQQKNSFLTDTLGKQIFPAGLDIMDIPRTPGEACGKMFDSEGVATSNHYIVKDGVVQEYFVNTYMSNKLGIAPTIEDATRPVVCKYGNAVSRQDVMEACGDGILITDFCGGNSNPATGDFSYAIQGYRFKDGKIVHPVREMLITGNILSLWSKLLYAGDDARRCRSKLTPTLAFDEVDFSG